MILGKLGEEPVARTGTMQSLVQHPLEPAREDRVEALATPSHDRRSACSGQASRARRQQVHRQRRAAASCGRPRRSRRHPHPGRGPACGILLVSGKAMIHLRSRFKRQRARSRA